MAIIPPIAAPELKIPCAKARSLVGNHSALPLAAPGQLKISNNYLYHAIIGNDLPVL